MSILAYYLGCMYAGKSSSAVDQLINSTHQHKIIISPNAHKRGFVSRLHKLSDLNQSIQLKAQLDQLPASLLSSQESLLIFIDEVQFIDQKSFWQLLDQAQSSANLDLILAGISYDQHAKAFANHQQILSLCPPAVIQKLYVPCATCASSQGEVSIRKWQSPDRITDDYAVLCMSCFNAFFQPPKPNQHHCAICNAANSSQQLRQWRSDEDHEDSQSPLCHHCYDHILSYGKDYSQDQQASCSCAT